jgi:hypothetical protein
MEQENRTQNIEGKCKFYHSWDGPQVNRCKFASDENIKISIFVQQEVDIGFVSCRLGHSKTT